MLQFPITVRWNILFIRHFFGILKIVCTECYTEIATHRVPGACREVSPFRGNGANMSIQRYENLAMATMELQ